MLDVEGRWGLEKQGRKGKRSRSRLYSLLLSVVATVVAACTPLTVSDSQQKQCSHAEEVKESFSILSSFFFFSSGDFCNYQNPP